MLHKKSKILLTILTAVLLCTSILGHSTATYSNETEESKKTSSFKTSGRIWIAGDSIAADHSYEDEDDYANFVHGWGEMIGSYLTDDARIFNKAISGQSAKYFIEETNYQDIMDGIGEGDILLIQFGHNDYKSAGPDHSTLPTDTEGSYKWYLKNYYIDPALQVGAMPVLCTSVVSCYFNDNTMTENQAQSKFAEAMRVLYEEYCGQGIEIGFIDTYALTQTMLNADISSAKDYFALKYDKSSGSYTTDENGNRSTSLDHVHFSAKGANATADIISQNLFIMYEDLNRFNKKGLVDGGEGISDAPYLISNWAQLYQILQDDERNTPQTYYKLTQDLMPAMQQQEWETIFRANLDGAGHTIKNVVGKSLSSLFDKNYGTISNLNMEYNLNHSMDNLQFPLVGDNYGTISNCNANGTITFNYISEEETSLWDCGMFAGFNHDGAVIDSCVNNAAITTNTNVPQVYLGGTAGRNAGTINNCQNTGELCIDTFDLSLNNAPTHTEVVCCSGGIAGIAADTSHITECISAKNPECYTTLKYVASAVLKDTIVPVTESELRTMLDEQLPTQEPGPSETPSPTEPSKLLKGDLNGDAQVTLEDAQLALKLALNIITPEEDQLTTGDLNQDGTIALDEAQHILKAALNIITLS